MKKIIFLCIFIFALFLVSCSEDTMKPHYDILNKHNACIVTVGKNYDVKKLDNYYDYKDYEGEEYDYVCFGINYADRENYTKEDLNTIYSFSYYYSKTAIMFFFNFEEYDLLSDIYDSDDIEYFSKNKRQYILLGYTNTKCIKSGTGSSNDKNFITNFISEMSFEIELLEGKK